MERLQSAAGQRWSHVTGWGHIKKNREGTKNLACLSDCESIYLLHVANKYLYLCVILLNVLSSFVCCVLPSLILTGHYGVTCGMQMLERERWTDLSYLIVWIPLRLRPHTPPRKVKNSQRLPLPSPLPCSLACVCGSSNYFRFIRLHINVVCIEPTPAPLVALVVCLPVAVTMEEADWTCCLMSSYNRLIVAAVATSIWERLPCPGALCLHID